MRSDPEPIAVAIFKDMSGIDGHIFFFESNKKIHVKAIFMELPGKHEFYMQTNNNKQQFEPVEIKTSGKPSVYEFNISTPIHEIENSIIGVSNQQVPITLTKNANNVNANNVNANKNTAHSKAMVIVEPRAHKHLQRVLENFHKKMKPEWDLYVFYGKSHGEFIKNATKQITNTNRRKVFLKPLGTDNLNANQYNQLLQHKDFWDQVNAENILVFQVDTALCGKSKRKMNNFTKYNYIGCDIGKSIGDKGWGGNHRRYGVGGLSFRKKSFILKCIKKQTRKNLPENVAFSNCVHNSHRKPTSLKNGKNFCSQGTFGKSVGSHKVNLMMNKKKAFYNYCPEAKKIANNF